jgi:hypothetical protein
MERAAISELINKLYFLTLFNATDYMFSGNSLDLSLCRLSRVEVLDIKKTLQTLVSRLKEGLQDDQDLRVRELILLAHWEAQSYWQEDYTDLFDYCQCLSRRCDEKDDRQRLIKEACEGVIEKIKAIVIHSEHTGSQYQYSHGLSVYFPWTEPVKGDPFPDVPAALTFEPQRKGENMAKDHREKPRKSREATAKDIIENYRGYAFTTDFISKSKDDSWLSFLQLYFETTRRTSRQEEDGPASPDEREEFESDIEFPDIHAVSSVSGAIMSSLPGPDKPSPSTGLACTCSTVKNYPRKMEIDLGRRGKPVKVPCLSSGALRAFKKKR